MSFQPTQIPGCALWLDGADPNGNGILPTNGSSISTWADKSGNNNNASGGVSPTYSRTSNAVVFNGSSQYLQNNYSASLQNETLFIVCFYDRPTYLSFTTLIASSGAGGRQISTASGNIGVNNQGVVSGPFGGPFPLQQIMMISYRCVSSAPNVTSEIFLNGTSLASLTYQQYTSGQTSLIGARPGPSIYWPGNIMEIIGFSNSLSMLQRQQVEGYLAWKWGIQASLPVTQPYRFFPPTSLAIQGSTEFNMVRTNAQSGTLALPAASTIPGRMLTFKDISGTFFNSSFTLSTVGIDRFENGANLKRLIEPFGYLTLASDGISKWYAIDGTSLNTYSIGSLTNNVQTSTNIISTSGMSVSTFGLVDQFFNTVSSLYTKSTLLYLGSNIIGGSKVGPTLFLPIRRPFQPNQISGLGLWLDAADTNTIRTSGGSVTGWNDKSGNGRNATQGASATLPSYNTATLNGLPVVAHTTTSGLTGTFPVNTLTSMFIFVVVNNTSSAVITNNQGGYVLWWNETGAWGQVQLLILQTRIDWRFGTGQVGNNPNLPLNSPANTGTSYNMFMTSKVNTAEQAFQNGTLVGNYTAASNAIANTNNTFVITGPITGNPTLYATNNIAEMLVYTTNVSTSRQQIEGYLAWKWGLVGDLPASHPFKNSPP